MRNKINIPIQTIIITIAFIACLSLLCEAIVVFASSGPSLETVATRASFDEVETVELDFITISEGEVNAYLSAGALAEPDSHNFDSYIYTYAVTQDALPESTDETDDEDDLGEYYNLAIAHPDTYVNVRKEPSTASEVVGYIYRGAVGTILDTSSDSDGNTWFYITSGNVTGYIFEEYFYSGQEAADKAIDYLTIYATVQCSRLNVRQEASADSARIGYIENGEKVIVKENQGDWLVVEYAEDSTGYIAAEYVSTSEEFTYARTIEEDKAIKEAEAKLQARTQEAENTATAETLTYVDVSTPPATTYTSNAELRQSIVANAMQYLGNPYVHGGATLAGGTDCSGFTSLLYAQYGIGLSRIPQGQYTSNGRSVSYAEAQPGDIICYSSNGSSCTHVALYIGNGQIIHSSTPRKGVITASVTSCGTILAIKNVID